MFDEFNTNFNTFVPNYSFDRIRPHTQWGLPPRSVLAHFVPAHFVPLVEDPSGYRGIVSLASLVPRRSSIDVHFGPFYDTHFCPTVDRPVVCTIMNLPVVTRHLFNKELIVDLAVDCRCCCCAITGWRLPPASIHSCCWSPCSCSHSSYSPSVHTAHSNGPIKPWWLNCLSSWHIVFVTD